MRDAETPINGAIEAETEGQRDTQPENTQYRQGRAEQPDDEEERQKRDHQLRCAGQVIKDRHDESHQHAGQHGRGKRRRNACDEVADRPDGAGDDDERCGKHKGADRGFHSDPAR